MYFVIFFQESDILESPQVYCRSNLGDKISDYEDLWTQDNAIGTPLSKGPLMSSFRPDVAHSKRTDVISETRKNFDLKYCSLKIIISSNFFCSIDYFADRQRAHANQFAYIRRKPSAQQTPQWAINSNK